MTGSVIVSTARTPLAKSHRGEFNITPGPTLAAFAVQAAVQRSGIDPALIEDAILGCGYPEGITGRNVARQAGRVRLFEIGNVFQAEVGTAPRETVRLAAAVVGEAAAEQWGQPARKVDFHDLKGDLESVAALSGAQLEFRPSLASHGHPGRSADVYRDNQKVGWIGQLHPRLQRALDLAVQSLDRVR